MQSVQLFQHAIQQWESRKPSGREEVYAFSKEMEVLCQAGTNLYVVDMKPDDPLLFGSDILVQKVDMKGLGDTLGDYPDQDYIRQDVIPFYVHVRKTGEVSWLRMKSNIQGHCAVYDRILLPMNDHGTPRWALSITKTRLLLPPMPELGVLTERQQDILLLMSQGFSSKESAQRLGISHRTVEHQITVIKKKLGAKNITEAVAIFVAKAIAG